MVFLFTKQKTSVLLPALTGKHRGRRSSAMECKRPEVLPIWSQVTGETHMLDAVSAYQHLGSVVTADASPAAEIAHGRALALGITRALGQKPFSNTQIPAGTRPLLRSLSASKFVFGSASLNLTTALHRRSWCKAYVDLWRRLLRRDWSTVQRSHSVYVW